MSTKINTKTNSNSTKTIEETKCLRKKQTMIMSEH